MKPTKLFLFGFFVLVFNLIWEFSHYRLYIDLTGIPSTLHLILASFIDLFLVFFIIFIISIFKKSKDWINHPNKLDYILIIFLGMLIAIIIEVYSMIYDRWTYTELMPTIFGIGISPLIQLFTTTIISLILIKIT